MDHHNGGGGGVSIIKQQFAIITSIKWRESGSRMTGTATNATQVSGRGDNPFPIN